MGKTLIKVDCVDQRLLVSSGPIIASGGRNEDEIEFSFCPLWDGFEKTAVFHREKDRAYHAAITDDRCVIPHEVLIDEGWMYFGVMGVKGDITRTSEILKYRISEGAITEGTKPSDPTPDIYEQILAQLSTVNKRLDQIGGASLDPQPFEVTGKLVQLDNFEGMPMSAVTRIEPVQAGSGDPYPGGGGKNLLPFTNSEQTSGGVTFKPQSDGRIHIEGTASANISYNLCGQWQSQTGVTLRAGYKYSRTTNITGVEAIAYGYNSGGAYKMIPEGTLTEDYSNAYIYLQVNSGRVVNGYFAPTLTVNGWSAEYIPYANIRPISGHTGAKLTRVGKNLLPNTATTKTENGVTFTVNADGSVTVNGTATATAFCAIGSVDFKANTKYVLTAGKSVSGAYVKIDTVNIIASSGIAEYTPSADATYSVTLRIGGGTTWTNVTFYPMIRLASDSDVTFEPYQGDTFSASFGQTVYGGTLDWGKGVLTVDRAYYAIGGDDIEYLDSDGVFTSYARSVPESDYPEVICSHYACARDYGQLLASSNRIALWGNGRMRIYDGQFSDLVSYRNYLNAQSTAGTPVQVCYKLANPTTIQLTPAQLTALQGMNNIFCDAGETAVSGRKDILWLTSHLIERINALESAIISTGGNV